MGRIRTIKPEFFRSRSLAKCERDARTTFAGLWTEADDHGRGIADVRLLKGAIWPLDDDISPEMIERFLTQLSRTGHIQLYNVDGERYYEIVNWEKHLAAAYRRGNPVHPEPPKRKQRPHAAACKEVQDARQSVSLHGTGNMEQGTGKGSSGADAPRATDDPVKARAHRLATLAFEQPVKPDLRSAGNPFAAVMGLYERRLRAGASVQELEAATRAGIDVWTVAGMQTAVARLHQGNGRTPRSDGTVAVLDEIQEAIGGRN